MRHELPASEDALKKYLNEIGRVPLLTAEDEVELAQRVEIGVSVQNDLECGLINDKVANPLIEDGIEAKLLFIESNLRLVVSIAKKYSLPPGVQLLDLIQEGNLGLEHAVDKFEWRKGFKFSTYATFWIRQAIGRFVDMKGTLIHIPQNQTTDLRAALSSLVQDEVELDPEMRMIYQRRTPISLSYEIGDEGDAVLEDLLPDPAHDTETDALDNVAIGESSGLIAGLMDSLSAREKEAIKLRFMLGETGGKELMSYKELGERLDMSHEGARRLVKRAVKVLRETAGKSSVEYPS